jgi:hypothetical protein
MVYEEVAGSVHVPLGVWKTRSRLVYTLKEADKTGSESEQTV